MQIEHYAMIAFGVWLIIAITFVRACIKGDNKTKKILDARADKNKTVFFVEHPALQWEDLDFERGEQPTIILPD